MSVIVGDGQYKYRVEENWAKLPDGWYFKDIGGVGVDKRDNVYVFNRGEHPVIVLDRDGNFLRSWGEGVFVRPHGLHMAPDDTVFLTDDADHTVRKCTLDGKVLMTLGVSGKPSEFFSGEPFHRCTHTALSPKGEIYVSDGYGNARVHKYTPDGKLIMSWGGPGTDPGQFNIVHNVCCDADGWVYIADRENHRIQVFNGDGKFEAQWKNLHRPCALHMESPANPVFYIGEYGPHYRPLTRNVPNLGPRISITDRHGNILARLGSQPAGMEPGQFFAPHGMCVDSRGDIYIGDVANVEWAYINIGVPKPDIIRTFQKLVKVS